VEYVGDENIRFTEEEAQAIKNAENSAFGISIPSLQYPHESHFTGIPNIQNDFVREDDFTLTGLFRESNNDINRIIRERNLNDSVALRALLWIFPACLLIFALAIKTLITLLKISFWIISQILVGVSIIAPLVFYGIIRISRYVIYNIQFQSVIREATRTVYRIYIFYQNITRLVYPHRAYIYSILIGSSMGLLLSYLIKVRQIW